jgi:NADPH-dependent 2,4-dienoyl-CoA reductase/sulfur reductase-like enzyme
MGHEYKKAVQPASRPKRIVVVGAGPAGITYALTAARRGHRLTIIEKADRVGGQLNAASVPAYKRPEFSRLLSYYELMLRQMGVDLRLGQAVTVEDLVQLDPDLVVLAVGSKPQGLSVPGGERAKTAVDVLLGNAEDMGDDVCIVGGNGVGLDTALFLREKNKNVTIVEMCNDIGSDLNFLLHWHVTDLIRDCAVEVRTGHRVVGVSEEGITASVDGRTVEIHCDDVVLAVGFEPVDTRDFEQALSAAGLHVQVTGACAETTHLFEAIHRAFWAALQA